MVAPSFDSDALEVLTKKPSLRLIKLKFEGLENGYFYKFVPGGFLLQSQDVNHVEKYQLKIVTDHKPSQKEMNDLMFAFQLVKYVKSNAILIAKEGKTIGIGAGQMSRVEAVEIALKKAGKFAEGAVLASDAFFPFKDSVELAAKYKIKAIIQPGGSKRDQESIDCCNEHGLSMVMTGVRHFRH